MKPVEKRLFSFREIKRLCWGSGGAATSCWRRTKDDPCNAKNCPKWKRAKETQLKISKKTYKMIEDEFTLACKRQNADSWNPSSVWKRSYYDGLTEAYDIVVKAIDKDNKKG